MSTVLWGVFAIVVPLVMMAICYFWWYPSRRLRVVERRWLDWRAGHAVRGGYVVQHGMRHYRSPYGTHERQVIDAQATVLERGPDEAVLLGPISAWVAEGEARAVREWEAKNAKAPDPSQKWATLYHIEQDAYHAVPNNPDVIAHFRTRGWIPRDPDLP